MTISYFVAIAITQAQALIAESETMKLFQNDLAGVPAEDRLEWAIKNIRDYMLPDEYAGALWGVLPQYTQASLLRSHLGSYPTFGMFTRLLHENMRKQQVNIESIKMIAGEAFKLVDNYDNASYQILREASREILDLMVAVAEEFSHDTEY